MATVLQEGEGDEKKFQTEFITNIQKTATNHSLVDFFITFFKSKQIGLYLPQLKVEHKFK